jgi:hypothetical protein
MTILLAVFQIVLGFALLKFIPNAKEEDICFTTAYYLITN